MRLITIRHGETDMNLTAIVQGQKDASLSEVGLGQAEKTGQFLRDTKIDFAYVSPLIRARQTAEAILAHHPETEVTYDPALMERSFGKYEGQHRDIFYKDMEKAGATYAHFEPEEGESWQMAGERFGSFYRDKVLAKHGNTDDTVMIVAHGGVLMYFLLALDNKMHEQEDFKEYYHSHHPKNAAISIFDVDADGNHSLVQLNDVGHLI